MLKNLEYGTILRVELKSGEKREVTVIKARENHMLVREQFHGEYTLNYNDVLFVYDGDELHTARVLRTLGAAHVTKITQAPVPIRVTSLIKHLFGNNAQAKLETV